MIYHLEVLSLARNGLGFKTGAHLMHKLLGLGEQQVKTSRLKSIDISYNTISQLVINSVNKLIGSLALSDGGNQIHVSRKVSAL